jgi:alpha-glucosidase
MTIIGSAKLNRRDNVNWNICIRLALMLASIIAPVAANAASVNSPDGKIVVSVIADGEGVPTWTVNRGNEAIIAPSHLGFSLTDRDPIRRNFAVESESAVAVVDATWELPWGERTMVADRHNEVAITFAEKSANPRKFIVRIRVFNDGVGFRYEFPKQSGFETANIAEELTEFNLAQNGTAWWIPAGDWNRYEYLYNKTPITGISMAHTPVTMKLASGTHIAFHEAALVDYSSMWLRRMDGLRFRSFLSPSSRGAKVVRALPFNTPWRSIRIADNAAGIYDNDLELNLNEPNKLGDVSWVKPSKYIGIWWEMHLEKSSWASGAKHGATTANAKRHIDFAAKNGFRGVLIEGWNKGWDGNWFGNGREFSFTEAYPDFDLKAVTDYARKKNVRLVGHHETGANIAVYESQLEDAMALYERMGVDSVKSGYVADAGGIIARNADINDPVGAEIFEWHDGQRMAQHHLKVVEVAAKHHIAVNPHEPIKDTGLRRTYPNWIAREGARGTEYEAWGVPKNTPEHVPTLVFTRMLSGPMDYTPGIFSLKGRDGGPIQSTLARQLALYLVLYSPIQMAADLPENLAKWPKALDFVKLVPTDWSETRTIAGEVGELVVTARKDRASENWFVGAVTDSNARTLQVPLAFLDPGKKYTAKIWRDGAGADGLGTDRHAMTTETKPVSSADIMRIAVARAGGFAIMLSPTK